MAIHGLDYAKENWYVCADDPGKRDTLEESRQEGATIFFFRAIPNVIMTEIQDDQSTHTIRALSSGVGAMEQVMNQRSTRRNRDCFRFGIKRWENFNTEEGQPIPCITDKEMKNGKLYEVVHEESLNAIHISTIGEVGGEIFQRNSMDMTKRKKFEAALSELGGSKDGTAENAAISSATNEDASETHEPEIAKNSKPSSPKRKSKTPTPEIVSADGSAPTLSNLSG